MSETGPALSQFGGLSSRKYQDGLLGWDDAGGPSLSLKIPWPRSVTKLKQMPYNPTRKLHQTAISLRSIAAGELTRRTAMNDDTIELLQKYEKLPKLYCGRELEIEFENEADFKEVDPDVARAVGVEAGASIRSYMKLTSKEDLWFYLYAERDVAEEVLAIPKGARVRAQAVTLFGIVKDVFIGESGAAITRRVTCTGLLLKRIIAVELP